MGNLLFSFDGRINGVEFKKGAVVLLAVNFFLWSAWFLGVGVGFPAMMLSFILIYCWTCLFTKRFHDAGQPGWWFLLLFVIFCVASYLLANFLLLALVDMADLQEMVSFGDTIDPENPNFEELMPELNRFFKNIVVPYAAAYLITGAIIAFVTNAILKSQPGANQYGPSGANTFD